jgi:hypothetical protein
MKNNIFYQNSVALDAEAIHGIDFVSPRGHPRIAEGLSLCLVFREFRAGTASGIRIVAKWRLPGTFPGHACSGA